MALAADKNPVAKTGSEVFNLLVIVGAVCLISTDGLALDWKILAREASFFAASLVAILVVLSDELVTVRRNESQSSSEFVIGLKSAFDEMEKNLGSFERD